MSTITDAEVEAGFRMLWSRGILPRDCKRTREDVRAVLEAAAAARPAPQAGEVVEIIEALQAAAKFHPIFGPKYARAADLLAAQAAALAAKDAALQAILDYIPPPDPDKDPYTQIAAFAKRTARAALAPAGKAAPRTAPKPASEMSDQELQADFTEHCLLWDKRATEDEGHSGSPGEWIVERLDELRTEAKRRGVALVEAPAPAGKEVKNAPSM